MDAKEYVDNLIGRLQGELAKALKEFVKLEYYNPNHDAMYQVVKDLRTSIANMEHTLSLIDDEAI